jgi:murein DD-endopeptidase MepM/ murein hydrolase activator NlpD
MAKSKKYVFNPRTLSYEVKRSSRKARIIRSLVFFAGSVLLSVLYFWLYVSVFGMELPKTLILKKQNAEWASRMEVMNRQIDKYEDALTTLQMRDDDIYRSIFGMHEIPSEVREAGFGGVNRYAHYDMMQQGAPLKKVAIRLDVLTKKTYIQSKSFDEVALLSKRAGEMASCIPAISPVVPDRRIYRLSSSFGYRSDPFTGKSKRHSGVDLPSSQVILYMLQEMVWWRR